MATNTPKQIIDPDRFERSEKLQQTVMNLMIEMKEMFSTYQEYKTIIMNLTTVSKELNSIRIKEITGDIASDAPIDQEK